jgi:hypothetical protein
VPGRRWRALLPVEILDQLHLAVDVGEQHGDGLALAHKIVGGGRGSHSKVRLLGVPSSRRRFLGARRTTRRIFRRLNSTSTIRAFSCKRTTALGAKFATFAIVSSAFRRGHVPPFALALVDQLVEQRLGLLQDGRIETLGEPVVGGRMRCPGQLRTECIC